MMPFSPITLGQQIKSAEVEGFVLTETKHAPSLVIPSHAHEHASLSFVLNGSFIETLNRQARQCAPFNLVIKPAGEIHSDRYGQLGAQCLIIEIKPGRMERLRSVSRLLNSPSLLQSDSLSLLAMRVYSEFQAMDAASVLTIEGLILEMLAEASRSYSMRKQGTTRPRWLLRAVELMNEEFAREGLTLSRVAAEVGVHPAHLARTFRRAYRSTVGDYVRRLRVEYAAREIARSDRSLAEIASAAGFYDQSHMTTAFRLHMRTTPAAFRAAFKTSNPATKKLRPSKT
ncbi:MAG: helix-turn-helix transcriptional regulator [Pyrinomonadaceae bacterium]|nr:helix-turn-helix transcriptional regulator [Pyrinomonadaceae bacterium]